MLRYRLHLLLALSTSVLMPGVSQAGWSGEWKTKGSDALIGLSTEPSSPNPSGLGLLIIGYKKRASCLPVVSLLVMKGTKLGSLLDQKVSKGRKDQLVVTVGGVEFTSTTQLNKYTNAGEMAMKASDALLSALANPNAPISVSVGKTTHLSFDRASNFTKANREAKANCD